MGHAGPEDHAERERLLWLLVGMHAGALTPVSENEKRGLERVLAILDRKLAEGGGISGESADADNHNRFYRGRWSAFRECAIMLRSATTDARTKGDGNGCAPNAKRYCSLF